MSRTSASAAAAATDDGMDGRRTAAGLMELMSPVSADAMSPVDMTRDRPFGVSHDMDVEAGMECMDTYTVMREVETVDEGFDTELDYIEFRRSLVDWICEKGEEKFKLSQSTNHAACALLDRICQSADVGRDQLQLIAAVCLVIAAKYEEAEENVPDLRRLLGLMRGAYGTGEFHRAEVLCLTHLDWKVSVVTPVHALEYFSRCGITFCSDRMASTGEGLVDKVPVYCEKYMRFFADLCLQHIQFSGIAPTRLAAAIVLAARRSVGVTPIWNPSLSRVLGYDNVALAEVYDMIWEEFRLNFPSQADTATAVYTRADISTSILTPFTPSAFSMHRAISLGSVSPISSSGGPALSSASTASVFRPHDPLSSSSSAAANPSRKYQAPHVPASSHSHFDIAKRP